MPAAHAAISKTLTDPLGHVTTWTHDDQGRVETKTFADQTSIGYTYENTMNRLKRVTDAKGQQTNFTYRVDDSLRQVSYTSVAVPMPTVNFTYEMYYPRMQTMVDGDGLTTYAYKPVGVDGALQLATVDGPLAADTLVFDYDALGRLLNRTIEEAGSRDRVFDALSRLTNETDGLGAFVYGYDGPTDRLQSMTYPNGQVTTMAYLPRADDRRLGTLTNLGAASTLLSQFVYTYNDDGDILTWSQGPGSPSLDVATYDDTHWLETYTNATGSYSYIYDDDANRTIETTPSFTRVFTPNTVNAYTGYTEGAQVVTFTNDLNGNLTDDAIHTYEWDGADRLTAVTTGTRRSELSYDGFGRRSRIIEKDGATVLSDRRYIWCGEPTPCEERDTATNAITRRFFRNGWTEPGTSTSYFYARDHLGSVREVVDAGGNAVGRYEYDPWGRQRRTLGTIEAPLGYAGYWSHANGELNLTWYRAYRPEIARWLSRDPLGEFGAGGATAGDANLYAYVRESPLRWLDPFGLAPYTNNSPMPILYKPEHVENQPPLIAPQGVEVQVDGIYSPSGSANPICLKIPNNCTGETDATGKTSIQCDFRQYDPWDRGRPRIVTPMELSTPDFKNWPDPYTGRHWPFPGWAKP